MARHAPFRSSIFLGWLWLICGGGSWVVAAVPMQAVILFDTSGSMRQNDPLRLSHVAAQLFLDLTQPQDHVGLVAFSDEGVPLFPLTPMQTPAAGKSLRLMLRSLRFDGQTTDLRAALEAALQSFPEQRPADSRALALLLTDGKLDLGASRRADEPLVLEYLRTTLLPQYRNRHIALYTIAFTAAADQALLKEMAQATAGEFRFIANAAMLHKAFSELFVMAKQAESVPIEEGAIRLDASIQEASLVLSKPTPDEPIALMTPQQERLDATSQHPGVEWQATAFYDRVRLTQPEPGTWRIERASSGRDDMAIIGASTLRFDVRLTPDFLEMQAPLTLHAWFSEQGQPIRSPQWLGNLTVQADITTPTGKRDTVALAWQDSGEFSATVAIAAAPGAYEVAVLASSPTLHRQRTLSFVPHPLCFVPTVSADPPVTVRVRLTPDCPAFSQLAIATQYVMVPDVAREPVWTPLQSSPPRTFQTRLPRPTDAAAHAILIRIQGDREGQDAFTVFRGPLPLPDLPPPDVDWQRLGKTVGLQLLGLNVALGLIVGGGYHVYRARKRRRDAHA